MRAGAILCGDGSNRHAGDIDIERRAFDRGEVLKMKLLKTLTFALFAAGILSALEITKWYLKEK